MIGAGRGFVVIVAPPIQTEGETIYVPPPASEGITVERGLDYSADLEKRAEAAIFRLMFDTGTGGWIPKLESKIRSTGLSQEMWQEVLRNVVRSRYDDSEIHKGADLGVEIAKNDAGIFPRAFELGLHRFGKIEDIIVQRETERWIADYESDGINQKIITEEELLALARRLAKLYDLPLVSVIGSLENIFENVHGFVILRDPSPAVNGPQMATSDWQSAIDYSLLLSAVEDISKNPIRMTEVGIFESKLRLLGESLRQARDGNPNSFLSHPMQAAWAYRILETSGFGIMPTAAETLGALKPVARESIWAWTHLRGLNQSTLFQGPASRPQFQPVIVDRPSILQRLANQFPNRHLLLSAIEQLKDENSIVIFLWEYSNYLRDTLGVPRLDLFLREQVGYVFGRLEASTPAFDTWMQILNRHYGIQADPAWRHSADPARSNGTGR